MQQLETEKHWVHQFSDCKAQWSKAVSWAAGWKAKEGGTSPELSHCSSPATASGEEESQLQLNYCPKATATILNADTVTFF